MACYSSLRALPEGKNATPLCVAVRLESLELCTYIIEEGADVNLGYLAGMGPLCLALYQKRYEIAELLIKSGANVQIPDREGVTPMYYAIDKDSPVSIVKAILSAGFPKDGEILPKMEKITPLAKAISDENVPVVKFLLGQNVDVNLFTSKGITPLIISITIKSPEIVKLLIDHGANVEGLSMNDAPPLFLAVQIEDTTILQILIDAGVDVNRMFTPLKYPHNTFIIPYTTPLQLAAMGSNLPATMLLLKHGANINARNPMNNCTVLHMVFSIQIQTMGEKNKNNHRKVIQFLLENGADMNARDIDGKLPIHITFMSKNWIALEEYIRFGVSLNDNVSQEHGSIFRFVITHEVVSLVELCLAFGADSFQKFCNDPIYSDVLKSGSPDILRLFWKYNHHFDDIPLRGMPLSKPSIVCLLDNQSRFIQSIKNCDPEQVKEALKQGASVNCCSRDFGYPLHIASVSGDAEVVKILLENGATISTLNSMGYSALHEAAKGGHLETCKLLLRHGACLDYRGPGGVTPRQLAQQEGHTNVVALFQRTSRFFSLLKHNNAKIVDDIKKKLGSEEFYLYMNCVNHKGNTLLGEALCLDLKEVGKNLMSFKLKALL